MSDQTIAFTVWQDEGGTSSGDGDGHSTYLYDLGTGELVDLGYQVPAFDFAPQVAGRYVIWYSGAAGHVGRLATK